jgi:hypothetical protein
MGGVGLEKEGRIAEQTDETYQINEITYLNIKRKNGALNHLSLKVLRANALYVSTIEVIK